MKNALLIAALATSLNSSAQNLPSTSGMLHPISNLFEIPRTGSEDEVVNTHETIYHHLPLQLTTLQQNDSIYTWKWDSDITGWTVESKIIHMVYDDSLNLTFYIRQIWDGIGWMNSYLYNKTYDINNNLTVSTSKTWNGTTWENSGLTTYTYDANNNLTSEIRQYLDGSELVNSFHTYTYDDCNNKLIENHWGSSVGFSWFAVFTHDYTYEGNCNIICEFEDRAIFKPNWEHFKYTFTYDDKNNQTSEVDQKLITGVWVNVNKYTSTYNDSNNLTIVVRQDWIDSVWVNQLQDFYTYDIHDNQTSHISQELNENTWKMVDQWLYSYEGDHFKTSESHKHFDINAPATFVTDGDSAHYYFHTITTAINDFKAEDANFIVYPNPSSGKFTISSKSNISAIEIYNILGERVYSDSKFNYQTSNNIDLSDQGKGIYIINIYEGKLMYIRKIVLQ